MRNWTSFPMTMEAFPFGDATAHYVTATSKKCCQPPTTTAITLVLPPPVTYIPNENPNANPNPRPPTTKVSAVGQASSGQSVKEFRQDISICLDLDGLSHIPLVREKASILCAEPPILHVLNSMARRFPKTRYYFRVLRFVRQGSLSRRLN